MIENLFFRGNGKENNDSENSFDMNNPQAYRSKTNKIYEEDGESSFGDNSEGIDTIQELE